MKVLICGGRDYTDFCRFVFVMREIEIEHGPFTRIIHGNASGADSLAHMWVNARLDRMSEGAYPAEWKKHGKAAGFMRNQEMLEYEHPNLVIAFPGGRGTADMVRRAKAANVEVLEVS